MSRIAPFILSVVAFALAGCQTHRISKDTVFNLDNVPVDQVEGPVEVTIVDARPEWEKKPFDGNVSLVPLENLVPSPIQRLEREFQNRARELRERPLKVSFELQSFRVVFKDSDPFPHLEELILPDFGSNNNLSSVSSSGGELVVLGVIVAVVGVLDLAILSYDVTLTTAHCIRHSRRRLKELVADYSPGLTCDLLVAAKVEWPNGKIEEMNLGATVNRSSLRVEDGGAPGREHDLRLVVNAACSSVAREFKQRILDPKAEILPPTREVKPAFTAYSGD
jgi:hypothetical protein